MSDEGSWGKWFVRAVLGAVVAALIGVAVTSAISGSSSGNSESSGSSGSSELTNGGGLPAAEPGATAAPVASTTGTSVAPVSQGCVLTINHIGASIRDKPAHDAREIRAVPNGQYVPISTELVDWAGSEELWFLITVDGKEGWIVDNTILIPEKTFDCP